MNIINYNMIFALINLIKRCKFTFVLNLNYVVLQYAVLIFEIVFLYYLISVELNKHRHNILSCFNSLLPFL